MTSAHTHQVGQDDGEAKSRSLDPGEFSCCICFELLLDPVVGNCGHDFCKHCIEDWTNSRLRAKMEVHCPVCRSPLLPSASSTFGVCIRLRETITKLFPQLAAARRKEVESCPRPPIALEPAESDSEDYEDYLEGFAASAEAYRALSERLALSVSFFGSGEAHYTPTSQNLDSPNRRSLELLLQPPWPPVNHGTRQNEGSSRLQPPSRAPTATLPEEFRGRGTNPDPTLQVHHSAAAGPRIQPFNEIGSLGYAYPNMLQAHLHPAAPDGQRSYGLQHRHVQHDDYLDLRNLQQMLLPAQSLQPPATSYNPHLLAALVSLQTLANASAQPGLRHQGNHPGQPQSVQQVPYGYSMCPYGPMQPVMQVSLVNPQLNCSGRVGLTELPAVYSHSSMALDPCLVEGSWAAIPAPELTAAVLPFIATAIATPLPFRLH